jgi:phenylacetate-CoA ligase
MSARSFLVKSLFKKQKGFFDTLEKLERSQYWSEADLQVYQENKLRKLIAHAYETVPYYKDTFDKKRLKPADIKYISDLHKLPILDKETLRKNRQRMFSTVSIQKIKFNITSGSTGVPLSVANHESASIVERALFYRFLRWMGYEWGDEIITFWGGRIVQSLGKKMKGSISRMMYNQRLFDTYKINDELLSKLISKIRKSPPKILRGYTSSINFLATKFLEIGLNIKMNAISPTAEKLFRFQRDNIKKAFGKNIYNLYGCGETNSLAFECEKHEGMHIASEHVILEILNEENQKDLSGRVIITNLDNYAMPIIRYENGDLAEMSAKQCSCLRELPLLKEIQGRIYDIIEGLNGRKVHTGFLDEIFLESGLAEKCKIKELRIIQERNDKLRFEVATNDKFRREDQASIADLVYEYLGKMEIEFIRVDKIPETKTGKRKFVVPYKR